MSRFTGQHRNRVDSKGRISIPAPFRTWLRVPEREGGAVVVLAPSLIHPCIEGMTLAALDEIIRSLDRLDLLSEDAQDIAAATCGCSLELEADREGRVVLPADLAAHAALGEAALFVGMGRSFQIWEPEAGLRRLAEARTRVRAGRLALPPAPPLPSRPTGTGGGGVSHVPVMLPEVLDALSPLPGEAMLDATFGGGGYSAALLERGCTVWAIDRDPEAIARGAALAARHPGRLHLLEGGFGDMAALLQARGVTALDGVVLDLGVSSFQLDDPARGFSFRADGPLDMRMSRSGPTAADLVATLSERELADTLWALGEERHARRIARAIVAERAREPIGTTGRLASIIRAAAPAPPGPHRIDPATRSFQALRIRVNDELGEIERALEAAAGLLAPGGRLCVVAFHSLEDRLVKRFMLGAAGRAPAPSRHDPRGLPARPASAFELLATQPRRPSEAEEAGNPRARSARLRALTRGPGDAPGDVPGHAPGHPPVTAEPRP